MRRAYLLVYNHGFGTRQEVKNLLNHIPEVVNWRYESPNCFFLVADADANQLADEFMQFAEGEENALFLVTEYAPDKSQGLLTKEAWSLLNDKRTTRALEFGSSREKTI